MGLSQIVFDIDFEKDIREKDTRPLTEKADPLALSWAAYRVWEKFPERRWVAWTDVEAHEHDHEMARETRRYYRNRLAMRALKSQNEPSQFSRDLYDICNGGIMRECHRGMLYRLPYFYVEDIRRAELIEHTQNQPTLDVPPFLKESRTLSLRRYQRIFHSRKNREIVEYWFHDEETGNAVEWPVNYDNPLRSMVEHIYRSQDRVQLHAHYLYGHDTHNDFYFWKVSRPELRIG
jgi:hypothetical protein